MVMITVGLRISSSGICSCVVGIAVPDVSKDRDALTLMI